VEIVKHTQPFEYYTVDNFLTFDENCLVYNLCLDSLDVNAYNNKSMFFEYGEYQNNAGVNTILPPEIWTKIHNQLLEINDYLSITEQDLKWSFSTNITYDHKDKPLRPHNDDYEKLKQYGSGKIKCLIYLGLNDIDYTDWGTKLYTKADDYSSYVKEIPFVPGNAFIFTPNSTSYHGTEFINGLSSYRFILGAEYA